MARMAAGISSSSNSGNAAQNTRNSQSGNAAKAQFTQSFDVVEGIQRSGAGGHAANSNEATAQRFKSNSDRMAQVAIQDTRDTLLWVSKFGDGPADRALLRQAARTMKPNQYKDLMTERWVNGCCSYPACGNSPRREYDADKPVYRIQLRSRKVTDTSASTKFCSDECARRSAWYEGSCLSQQSAFSSMSSLPSTSEPVRLLEDMEEQQASSSSLLSGMNSNASRQEESTDMPSPQMAAETDPYSQEADNFLARLAIIERMPASAPAPPTLSTTLTSPEDRLPTASIHVRQQVHTGGGSSALLPFDMTNVQRELVASQQGVRATVGRETAGQTDDGDEGRTRRVEIDVDPENREALEQGWELFKQMRENGEME